MPLSVPRTSEGQSSVSIELRVLTGLDIAQREIPVPRVGEIVTLDDEDWEVWEIPQSIDMVIFAKAADLREAGIR